jgi:hypothetical protein
MPGMLSARGGGERPGELPTAPPFPTDPASDGPRISMTGIPFPPAPPVPEGELSPAARAAIEDLFEGINGGLISEPPIEALGRSGDPRVLWFLRDLFRFGAMNTARAIFAAFEELTGVAPEDLNLSSVANHLIAWDLPAYPGYTKDKERLFLLIEPRWQPFFDDEDSNIDWRWVEWGGVLIDDRRIGSPEVPCFRCIPALDDPPVTTADRGDWYPDDRLVFGIVINGEARAYPRNQMEIHEMVNDTLGGRRIGIPYCTLCLSAQAYYLDDVEGFEPILRTSGLLARSNKFMYDLSTFSAIDTFTGEAISGPLLDAGVVLNQVTVVTSTWGEWKRAHPGTTILAEDGGRGQGYRYPLDPLGDRDENGPIFPVGDVDPRLPVHERVLGVIAADGTPVAFPVVNAAIALRRGATISHLGIDVIFDGDGLRATINGEDVVSHESFWFAWSQFREGTELWELE